MATVPDSPTFNYKDILTAVYGSTGSQGLTDAFDDSSVHYFDESYIPSGFDPYAADKSGYEMYYFRNYGEDNAIKTLSTGLYTTHDNGFVVNEGYSWTNVQGATSGVITGTSYFEVRVADADSGNFSYNWQISRSFMSFDLSSIPSDSILESGKLTIYIDTEVDSGNHDFTVYVGSQGSSITTGDFDAYDSTYSYNYTKTFYTDRVEIDFSSGESNIESAFGSIMYVALVHALDISSQPPDNVEDSFNFYKDVGGTNEPNLDITYKLH